jgi:hypothetical protein
MEDPPHEDKAGILITILIPNRKYSVAQLIKMSLVSPF